MKILLTNDDGIDAPGINTLWGVLSDAGHDVTLVAPDREQSASSHSITLHHPLRIRTLPSGGKAVDGTPTDCVLVACHGIRVQPDVVVSGINHGPNMGEDVTYSGTVAAAFEAHILGLPAIAASMKDRDGGDFLGGARLVADLVGRIGQWSLDTPPLLNVNFPPGAASAWGAPVITRLGTRKYPEEIVEKEDPRGRKYYWIGGSEPIWVGGKDTDFAVVSAGGVSVTPLHLQLTDDAARAELRSWDLSGVR